MNSGPSLETCPSCPIQLGVDPLTGAQTRAVLLASLQARLAAGQPATLLLLDLDGFKLINDTLGHLAGDRLLRAVADRIRRVLRREDGLARLGGDEFALLLPELSDEKAAEIGGRIVNLLGRPFLLDGQAAHVGVSIGCARAPRDAADPTELIRMADLALYSAKEGGRGRMAFASPCLRADAEEQSRLENDLRAALALDQFRLAFQPQYDLRTGQLSGFEALIRWHHPTRGAVGPDVFIPVMERSRLIVEAGAWALHQAAIATQEFAAQLRLAELPRMAVNVSAAQFAFGGLVPQVAAALSSSGTDPRHIEIEVTETALLRPGADTLDQLRALQATGIEIALDDFGTGYSSLSLLREFAFDRLKIDRSFLSDDPRSRVILGSTSRMAQELGLRTTAEGIETPGQLALVRQLGCTDVQGFLTGRPVPACGGIAPSIPLTALLSTTSQDEAA